MRNRLLSTFSVAAIIALLVAMPLPASSSPWVLGEDELVVSGRFDFQQANKEYLNAGELEPYPLNGQHRAATFETTLRLGVVQDLELELSLPLKLVSYRSDPVILLPCSGKKNLDCHQRNVISLSRTTSGLSDIGLGATYQVFDGSYAGALELRLKTPTGYEMPAGTFGEEPDNSRELKQNPGEFVRPENVQDDVTLGDGQVDLSGLALFGASFPTRTFVRVDTGYKLRLAGAADQVLGHLQVGQLVGKRVLFIAGSKLAHSVEKGRVIGVSAAAKDPTLPAEQYAGLRNLRLRERRLGHDVLKAHAGALFRLTPDVELTLQFSRILWGRNLARTSTVSLGFGSKFDLAGGA